MLNSPWKTIPKPEACSFIKKEFLAQVLSCEFCDISKNTFSTEHLRTTASGFRIVCYLFVGHPEHFRKILF